MLSRPLAAKVGVGVLALALGATACGGTSSGSSAATKPTTAPSSTASAMSMSADTTASQAATLRAGLDQLFREHVNLTGFTVQTAVISGVGSKQTAAALKALDANTVAIGDAVGSVYGDAAKAGFLRMWRAHIGFFVDYTKALASGDRAAVKAAEAKLANYQRDFGTFLATATGLPADAVSADLQGHIQTLEAAIQAILAKSPTAAAKISMAEDHMAGTAAVLAKAIAAQKHLS